MKKFFTTLMLLLLVAFPGRATDRHVGSGQSYTTINAALDAANDGDTIIIHEGIYRETCVAQCDNLTIKAADEEHVVISGLDPVSGWTQDAGEVYWAGVNISTNLDFPQVFVNNRRINPAAYPDFAEDPTNYELWGQDDIWTDTNGVVNFSTGKPDNYWVGGLCLNIAGTSWQANQGVIESSTADTLLCGSLERWQDKNTGEGRGYILFHRNALDHSNEFHYDPSEGRVYLWQPGGGDPDNSSVEVRTRHLGLDFNEKSGVRVEGITFLAAAVDMEFTADCTLSECNVLYGTAYYHGFGEKRAPRQFAVDCYEARRSLVERCYIAHGWGGGVTFRCDRSNPWGTDNVLRDSVLEDLGWSAITWGSVLVWGKDKDTQVVGNTLRNIGSEAITGYPRRAEINSNYIASAMNISRDGGAIYVYGTGEDTSRSYNWIEQCFDYIAMGRGYDHNNVRGIYTDGGADGHLIHHNVIWRCSDGVNSNSEGGKGDGMIHHIVVHNNTFWDIEDTMMSGWWNPNGHGNAEDMTTYNNLGNGVSAKYYSDPPTIYVPFIGTEDWTKTTSDPDVIAAFTNGTIDNYESYWFEGSTLHVTFTNQIFNNYSTPEEGTTAADLFVDSTPDSFADFQLKAGSAAIDYGVVHDDAPGTFSGSSPDAGAYEYGENWTAGASEFGLLAFDDFESGDVSGGTGWMGDWVFQGDASVGATPLHGEVGVRLRGSAGSDYVERRVNLRGTKTGTLSYWWRGYSFDDSNECVRVSIVDGAGEYVLRIIADGEDAATDGVSWSEWRLDTIDISGYTFTADVQKIRFDASALSGSGDYFHLDDVRIDDYDSIPQSLPVPDAGLELWLDGNDVDGDGTVEGTAGESGLGAGDQVVFWADKSGNSRNATASDPDVVLTDSVLNGHALVQFHGDAKLPVGGSAFAVQTVIAVLNSSEDPWTKYRRVFRSLTAGNPGGGAVNAMIVNGGNGVNIYSTLPATGSDDVNTFVNGHDNKPGNNFEIYGSPHSEHKIVVALANVPTLGTNDWFISDVSGVGWRGDIAELIVYSRKLDDRELNDVGHYLEDKWDLDSTYLDSEFCGWLADYGWSSNFAVAATLDADEDRLSNLYEYGLGGVPTNGNDIGILPTLGNPADAGFQTLEYIYRRRRDAAKRGLDYHLELTEDLMSNVWTNDGYTETGTAVIDAAFEYVTNEIPTVLDSRMGRLHIGID
ncbi:MAG: hypothetical protein K9M45_01700 [Kiritimatiellales bacterium]|nr:hypothetical protein [Kiritimatiellales bacterium]